METQSLQNKNNVIYYKLKPRLFEGRYLQFYHKYLGHIFANDSLHDDGHILLRCVDQPALTVDRFIHVNDLEKIEVADAETK